MNVMPDLNIVLDYLVSRRKGHVVAETLHNLLKKEGYTIWLSASSVDNLQYVLFGECKRYKLDFSKITIEFDKYLNMVKIFSVTGASVREALKARDFEDHIIYANFKRLAPGSLVISDDKEFSKYSDVISPEEFIKKNTRDYSLLKCTTIPLLDLREEYRYMLEDVDEAVLRNIAQAKYIFGPQIKELEDKIADYIGVKHCVGVSSGTEALVLSLRALAIKLKGQEYWDRNDLIITTPFTFTATGDAILRAGATPVFVDIDPLTYNIDPGKIKSYLTTQQSDQSTKVVGILPVHLYGQSCQMDGIMSIAKEYNLFVLEDVAQAFGGTWNGSTGSPQKLGSIGTAGAFSFFPSKPLGGFGDGGMVATNDNEIVELVRMLLKHGGKDKYNVDHIGYNARLDTLQAAILLAKLKYVDEFNERRKKIAEIYTRELAGVAGIVLPCSSDHALCALHFAHCDDGHIFHQYTIRALNGKRDSLQSYLKEKGISTMVYYPVPLHKMKVFQGRMSAIADLPNTDNAPSEVLSLPMEPLQRENEIAYMIAQIKGFFSK